MADRAEIRLPHRSRISVTIKGRIQFISINQVNRIAIVIRTPDNDNNHNNSAHTQKID